MSHAPTVRLPRAEEVRLGSRGRTVARVGIGVGVLLLGTAWVAGPPAGAAVWLVAFLFYLTLALGGHFFTLLHHATRAGWSVVVRRIAEAAGATLPVFVLLFLPLATGLGELFPWAGAHEAEGHHAELLAHKAPYLNETSFLIRAGICLLAWAVLGWWFRRRSLAQDVTESFDSSRRLRAASAPALIVFAFTLTVAAFDWIMSLTPTWYSTIFGVHLFAGTAVAGLAVVSILAVLLARRGPLAPLLTPNHLHELGKLLFAFVVFWAYIAFSQFLLIWYANIPEETAWYAVRLAPGWRGLTVALALGHFVLPFFFLLPRAVKRRPSTLVAAALWMLALHLVDLYWLIVPAAGGAPPIAPLGLALLGMGAVVGGLFWLLLTGAPVVPVGDPRLAESLSFENV